MAIATDIGLTVNGVPCTAREGQTLLDVANGLGIRVPTLCHDPRIPPASSCWVCVVEVKAGDAWRTEPACSTRVSPGMVVRTESEEIRASRRWALELLLSDHYADCIAPCALACPAGVEIPAYVAAVAKGEYEQAIEIIRRDNPLPSVCGRVCPHVCETACRRNAVDTPVAINNLKRLASDECLAGGGLPAAEPGADTGRRVAVVGAGPAGLSAAYFLRRAGHAVTILDAAEKPGGMLRYGIPEYRLPRPVLDADIEAVTRMGVEFRQGVRLGRDFSVDQLQQQGFNVVFLALGAWKSQRLNIPGEEAEGVMGGVPFLSAVSRGELSRVSGHVAVIGGGNTAVDAARTALRAGASRVTILYRRDRAQMPAFAHEVTAAEAEGVEIRCMVGPVAIETADGRLRSVRLQRMAPGAPDASGRPRPVPVPGSEFALPVDLLIRGLGEEPDPPESEPCLTGHRRGSEPVRAVAPGVFAGGDFATGPSTAIEAIASGRRAAETIDAWLRTGEIPRPPGAVISRRDALAPVETQDYAHVGCSARAPMPHRDDAGRAGDFAEVEQGYAAATGRQEASRCLQCGCSTYDTCDLRALMQEYGIAPSRHRGAVHRYRVEPLRPGLRLDMNKCIRCSRCIGVCRDIAGVEALTFVRRGFDTRILFALDPESPGAPACDACVARGALCVETCPTGALTRETS